MSWQNSHIFSLKENPCYIFLLAALRCSSFVLEPRGDLSTAQHLLCSRSDLFYTDTSLIRTLCSVPSVSVLERFDCSWLQESNHRGSLPRRGPDSSTLEHFMEDNLLHTVSVTWDVCSPMLSLKVLCRFSVYCEVCEQQHSTYSEHGDTCIDQTRPSRARSSTLKIVRGRLQSPWWFDWGEVWYFE